MRAWAYALCAALSFIAFFLAGGLWRADLTIPFVYGNYGDAVSLVGSVRMIKQLLESGSVYWNPLLAAPFGQDAHDVPALYAIDYGVQYALVHLTRNPFLTYNLFYLLCPVANALAALYALRRIGIIYAAAIPCAVLYGNLFEVFWRNGHPFIAAYYAAPLACLALLRICEGQRGLDVVVPAIVVGLQSHYEAFFAGALAVAAAIIGSIQLRSWRPVIASLLFGAVCSVSFLLSLAPSLIWQIAHGSNSYATTRRAEEAITFALSIGQMILPIPDHRIPAFAFGRSVYDAIVSDAAKPSLINENASATLGLVATIGLILLVAATIASATRSVPRYLHNASLLAMSAIALGTVGGLGAVFNVAITAQIRAYNRISVFIAFFALLAIACVLESWWTSLRRQKRVALYAGLAVLVTGYGIFDQSPVHSADFAASRARYALDAAWVRQLEGALPLGAMILELPYVEFPDTPPIGHVEVVPYLFSASLRSSVGAISGSKEAEFEKRLAALPPERMLPEAAHVGFNGILIFRDGLPARGSDIESALAERLGRSPMVSADGSQSFFPIASGTAR
ncbi:MAG TPA: hypothetical protein VN905_02015 [Candidatus Binatia bacterium]|nr:hypothetical protein [Candidatus Binatia bacterium]